MNPDFRTELPVEGQIQIWIVLLNEWDSHLSELKALLSAEEIERAKRLKVRDKQEQSICSRGILRILLSSYLDNAPANIPIQTTQDGKPYLERSGLRFNVSHSGNRLLCGIARNFQIGIDIQQIYSIENIDTISRNYFSEGERNYLRSQPSDQLKDHFFSIWTAKEAYLKAIGSGFQESPIRISTLPDKFRKDFFLDDDGSKLKNRGWNIVSIEIDPEYKAAIAVSGEIQAIERIPFNPPDYFPD